MMAKIGGTHTKCPPNSIDPVDIVRVVSSEKG